MGSVQTRVKSYLGRYHILSQTSIINERQPQKKLRRKKEPIFLKWCLMMEESNQKKVEIKKEREGERGIDKFKSCFLKNSRQELASRPNERLSLSKEEVWMNLTCRCKPRIYK